MRGGDVGHYSNRDRFNALYHRVTERLSKEQNFVFVNLIILFLENRFDNFYFWSVNLIATICE